MRKMMCKELVVSGFAVIAMSYFAMGTEVEVGGRMWNYDGGIIYGVTPCDGEVAIPATIGGVKITAIGAESFRSETNLVSIVIPAGVVSIGMRAFQNCPNLRNVSIPSSVTLIDHWAFAQCVKLTNLTLPEGLETIATSAFLQCSSLGRVVVPDSVTQLGYAVFAECDAAEIIFGRGLTDIVKCNGVIASSKRYAKSTVAVGQHVPNLLGLYDMHGNVGQWWLDYFGDFDNDPAIDYPGASSGEKRVIRGYFWYVNYDASSFGRFSDEPYGKWYKDIYTGFTHCGFRLACIQE